VRAAQAAPALRGTRPPHAPLGLPSAAGSMAAGPAPPLEPQRAGGEGRGGGRSSPQLLRRGADSNPKWQRLVAARLHPGGEELPFALRRERAFKRSLTPAPRGAWPRREVEERQGAGGRFIVSAAQFSSGVGGLFAGPTARCEAQTSFFPFWKVVVGFGGRQQRYCAARRRRSGWLHPPKFSFGKYS